MTQTGLVTSAIRLRIEDNGQEFRRALKIEYFSRWSEGAQGSGIGLSITQTIISRHHGWIKLNSKPGHTAVDVILPSETHNELTYRLGRG